MILYFMQKLGSEDIICTTNSGLQKQKFYIFFNSAGVLNYSGPTYYKSTIGEARALHTVPSFYGKLHLPSISFALVFNFSMAVPA